MEDFVGKVVKISGKDNWGIDFSITGIVYTQREGFKGNSTIYSLIKTNGSIADKVVVMHNGEAKVTSTKIAPELRIALKEAYKAKLKLDAFEEKYKKELASHKDFLNSALISVKESSKEYSSSEFIDKVVALFDEKYPSSGDYYRKYFEADSWSSTQVSVRQSQEIEKWANPEKYPFLYREYDNTIHIRSDSKSLKDFCDRNAPRIIPELEKHCKVEVSASLGDKEWLSVQRVYTFPIKYGFSQMSIDDIKERFWGERSKKISIEEQISSAERQKGALENKFNANELTR